MAIETQESTVTATPVKPVRANVKIPFDSLQCTDGEVKPKFRSAYEIVGFKDHHYKTTDVTQYESELKEMNLGDLQSYAHQRGFLPTDNRTMLIDRLVRKFLEETSPMKGARIQQPAFAELHNDPVKLKKIKDILSRGR